jgi:exopolysaccharide biosynthesis predicted pyruvyltransferase EpsI
MISKEIEDDSESYFYYNLLEYTDKSVIETDDDILTTEAELGNNLLLERALDSPGVCCLSTNDVKMTEKEMWKIFSYIIDIHSLFTYLEFDFDIGEIDNIEGIRLNSHIFSSILAYQCINSLRNELKTSGIYGRWLNLINLLASHMRITFVLHTKDGDIEYIRKTLVPETSQAKVYQALRITSQPGDIIKLNKPPRS